MENQAVYHAIFECIRHVVRPECPLDCQYFCLEDEQWKEMGRIAELHCIIPFVFEQISKLPPGCGPGTPVLEKMENISFQSAIRYYEAAGYTCRLMKQLKEQGVQGVLLKGIGLGALYPKEELRKTNDIDFFVGNGDGYIRTVQQLAQMGLRSKQAGTDYHETFVSDSSSCEFELHSRVIKTLDNEIFDQAIDSVFNDLSGAVVEEETLYGNVPVLESTRNAFYLTLHMLKHFLSKGFGLRNLIDWALFIQQRGNTVDTERFFRYIDLIKVRGFLYLITGVCIRYFHVDIQFCPWVEDHMPGEAVMERFMQDVLNGGEFGVADSTRLRYSVGKDGGRLSACLAEIGRQTRMHFPNASRHRILMPVLWLARLALFAYNHTVRKRAPISQMARTYMSRNDIYQEVEIFKK